MFSIIKPYIFSLDPEAAHDLAIKSLKLNLLPKSIFNVANEEYLETELLNEKIPAGLHNVRWNGTSQDGRPMPAGLYFYEFKSNDFRDTGKMLLIKWFVS